MKAEIDFPDPVIEAIARTVVDSLRPLLVRKQEAPDPILTCDQLAEYLGVTRGWVYDQVALSVIPHFKARKFLRFRKSAIDRWIESQSIPASGPPSRPLRIAK